MQVFSPPRNYRYVYWLSLLLLVFMTACSSTGDNGDENLLAGAVIGPEGGVISIPSGSKDLPNASLVIPAGALSQSADIKISKVKEGELPSSAPANIQPQGIPFKLEPDGLTFNQGATLLLPASLFDIPDGYTSGDLVLYVITSTGWTELPATLAGGMVQVTLNHFSYYQLGIPVNHAPIISSQTPAGSSVTSAAEEDLNFSVIADDADGDSITYTWTASGGTLSSTSGSAVTWTAPETLGTVTIAVTAEDGKGGRATATWNVSVVAPTNHAPTINVFSPTATTVSLNYGATQNFSIIASDADGDTLTYAWTTDGGTFSFSDASATVFTAPATSGTLTVKVKVSDGKGGEAEQSWTVAVTEVTNHPPVINDVFPPTSTALQVEVSHMFVFAVIASDPDNDKLTYSWNAPTGSLNPTSSAATTWTAPVSEGSVTVSLTVSDGRGGITSCSWIIIVAPGHELEGFETTKVKCDPPAAPDYVIAIPGKTRGTIDVSWTPSETAESYLIDYGTTHGVYTGSKRVNSAATSYTLTGLIPGQVYYVAIKAESECGKSDYSPEFSNFAPTSVYYVPDDYETIQEALNAAAVAGGGAAPKALAGDLNPTDVLPTLNGDDVPTVVVVRDGYYFENINWPDCDWIALRSEKGPSQCIIDGGYNRSVINIDGYYLENEITSATQVIGFTITNGYDYEGGGIYGDGVSPRIINNIVLRNMVNSYDSGGGICLYYSTSLIIGNTFDSNYAWYSPGGAIYAEDSTVEIRHNVFTGNYAEVAGGAIFIETYYGYESYAEGVPTIITDNTFIQNSAPFGGAIGSCTALMEISDNTFSYNSARVEYEEFTGFGGAIYTTYSYFTANNNTFSGNSADISGGAIFCDDYGLVWYFVYNTNLTATGEIVTHDVSPTEDDFPIYITENTFSSNTAALMGFGGAIACFFMPAEITENTFNNNFARGMLIPMGPGMYYGGFGGAIYDCLAGAAIKENTFTGNLADSLAGAVLADGDGLLADLVFGGLGETAASLGVTLPYKPLANLSVDSFQPAAPLPGYDDLTPITDNIFNYNQAMNGGAVGCLDINDVEISSNTFNANSASVFSFLSLMMGDIYFMGGAIYCSYSSPEITHNTFKKNFISNNITESEENLLGGGAIACDDESSPLIEENLFAENYVYYGVGGAILTCYGSSPLINRNTMDLNEADEGAGIFAYECSPQITNNIISNSPYGGGIVSYDADTTIQYNDVWNNWEPDPYPNALPGDENFNISMDPLYVGGYPYNYDLKTGSPCDGTGGGGENRGAY